MVKLTINITYHQKVVSTYLLFANKVDIFKRRFIIQLLERMENIKFHVKFIFKNYKLGQLCVTNAATHYF